MWSRQPTVRTKKNISILWAWANDLIGKYFWKNWLSFWNFGTKTTSYLFLLQIKSYLGLFLIKMCCFWTKNLHYCIGHFSILKCCFSVFDMDSTLMVTMWLIIHFDCLNWSKMKHYLTFNLASAESYQIILLFNWNNLVICYVVWFDSTL